MNPVSEGPALNGFVKNASSSSDCRDRRSSVQAGGLELDILEVSIAPSASNSSVNISLEELN